MKTTFVWGRVPAFLWCRASRLFARSRRSFTSASFFPWLPEVDKTLFCGRIHLSSFIDTVFRGISGWSWDFWVFRWVVYPFMKAPDGVVFAKSLVQRGQGRENVNDDKADHQSMIRLKGWLWKRFLRLSLTIAEWMISISFIKGFEAISRNLSMKFLFIYFIELRKLAQIDLKIVILNHNLKEVRRLNQDKSSGSYSSSLSLTLGFDWWWRRLLSSSLKYYCICCS